MMADAGSNVHERQVLTWTIRAIRSKGEISRCAEMMAASDPWKRFGVSKAQAEESLTHDQIRLDGAVDNDQIVLGFLASMQYGVGFEPLIKYLCVDSNYRSKGIGTNLVSFFESLYSDAKNLYLFVSDINPNAARLYLRLGYVPTGALANYNVETQTEFLFRKSRGPRTTLPSPWFTSS